MAESKASTSIRESIIHPGRTTKYIQKTYGNKAFKVEGKKQTIKVEYLDKAIAKAKGEHKTSLERALVNAKNLKEVAARKMKG